MTKNCLHVVLSYWRVLLVLHAEFCQIYFLHYDGNKLMRVHPQLEKKLQEKLFTINLSQEY